MSERPFAANASGGALSRHQPRPLTSHEAIAKAVLQTHTVIRLTGEVPLRCPDVFHPYTVLPRAAAAARLGLAPVPASRSAPAIGKAAAGGASHKARHAAASAAAAAHSKDDDPPSPQPVLRIAYGGPMSERSPPRVPGDGGVYLHAKAVVQCGPIKAPLPPIASYDDVHVRICPPCQREAVRIFNQQLRACLAAEAAQRVALVRLEYSAHRALLASLDPSPATRDKLRGVKLAEDAARAVAERDSFFFFESLAHVWRLAMPEPHTPDKPVSTTAAMVRRAKALARAAGTTTKEDSALLVAKMLKWESDAAIFFAAAAKALQHEEGAARQRLVVHWLNATARLIQQCHSDESSTGKTIKKRMDVERARHFAKVVGSDIIQAGRHVIEMEELAARGSLTVLAKGSFMEALVMMAQHRLRDLMCKERQARERHDERSLASLFALYKSIVEERETIARAGLSDRREPEARHTVQVDHHSGLDALCEAGSLYARHAVCQALVVGSLDGSSVARLCGQEADARLQLDAWREAEAGQWPYALAGLASPGGGAPASPMRALALINSGGLQAPFAASGPFKSPRGRTAILGATRKEAAERLHIADDETTTRGQHFHAMLTEELAGAVAAEAVTLPMCGVAALDRLEATARDAICNDEDGRRTEVGSSITAHCAAAEIVETAVGVAADAAAIDRSASGLQDDVAAVERAEAAHRGAIEPDESDRRATVGKRITAAEVVERAIGAVPHVAAVERSESVERREICNEESDHRADVDKSVTAAEMVDSAVTCSLEAADMLQERH